MKRVAVITIKDSPNYGGILQSYALQYVVKKLGYECDLIDYMNQEFSKKFTFLGRPQEMSWIYWIYKKVQYPLMSYMKRRMLTFYRHMSLTEHIAHKKDLCKLNDKYDVFITGSDQVWACDLSFYDDSFFFDFVSESKRKISYAASFGRTLDMMQEKEKNYIKRNIGHLDNISLREESGVEIVKALSTMDACAVLDPTLLMNEQEWKTVAAPVEHEQYILCYLMQSRENDREGLRLAKELQKKTGWKIVKICRGLTSVLWGETLYVPTVEEWVGLFLNASFIISNSFHGVAFSINFNKPFYALLEGDIASGRNSRIYNICKQLGVEDRIVKIGEVNNTSFYDDIKYNEINEKLQYLRLESIRFLSQAME